MDSEIPFNLMIFTDSTKKNLYVFYYFNCFDYSFYYKPIKQVFFNIVIYENNNINNSRVHNLFKHTPNK